jgi:hypothetical protein
MDFKKMSELAEEIEEYNNPSYMFRTLAIRNLSEILANEEIGDSERFRKESHYKMDLERLSAPTLLAIYNIAMKKER